MEHMDAKLIETAVAVLAFVLLRAIAGRMIDRTITNNVLSKARGKVIRKGVNFILLMVALACLFFIWGVDQSELVLFVSSFLAVLGVALFAQWSILSNITSGMIIFFGHPVKLEDTISIMDKDYQLEGRVSDIGLFFVTLKTGKGERVTIPSNVFVQKMVKYSVDA